MANCRSCGKEIEWAETFRGAKVPLDVPPEKRMVRNEEGKMMVVDAYLSHFATCPNAAQHRKERKPDGND